jgi:periplasmic protein TonB
MFAESMLEASWAQRTRRGWTTLTSFGVQAVLLATLITIPLLRTIGIPLARTVTTPITLGRRSDPTPAKSQTHFHSTLVELVPYHGRIMLPTQIPRAIPRGADQASAEPEGDDRFPVGVGPSFGPGMEIPMPLSGTRPVMPTHAEASKPRFRTSLTLQGSLIRRVEPVYPAPARSARIQGPVVLEATISKEGTMEKLQVISGHPILAPAAIDAVKQWRYRPYLLNGEAIEVETQITVNFILAN